MFLLSRAWAKFTFGFAGCFVVEANDFFFTEGSGVEKDDDATAAAAAVVGEELGKIASEDSVAESIR